MSSSISAWTDCGSVPTHRSRFWLLQDGVSELNRLRRERSARSASHYRRKALIQQHYQESLRLEDVSNAVGFNATYFSAMFKKETGQNFMDYLTELRMNKAKELLCGDECSVQDVAEQVGYRDLKYFSACSRKPPESVRRTIKSCTGR